MPFTIDDLNYDKDSKERMPWEHYLELYAKADPKEIASRLSIPYDEEAKEFTLTFLGSEYKITYPDFQVKHVADEKKCYPLEDMIYAKILTIRFLLNGSASVGTGRFKTYREIVGKQDLGRRRELIVPLPQDHLDLISRINGKLISHISEFHRSAFHMIHYKPEIIQSVSIGKCKPFDTTSVKLSQVPFSPWHFPVSFKPASAHRGGTI